MKHNLSILDLENNSRLRLEAFELIAKPEHYKVLFKIMKENYIDLNSGTSKMLASSQIAELFNSKINEPEMYQKLMKMAIENYEKFEDLDDIPIRECDFMVEHDSVKSYFFIHERLELSYENSMYILSRLLVDEFSDVLLYNTLIDNEGWTEYKNLGTTYMNKVAIAYKEYLAEKVLLEKD